STSYGVTGARGARSSPGPHGDRIRTRSSARCFRNRIVRAADLAQVPPRATAGGIGPLDECVAVVADVTA
ncbi:MAG: hypothetical protein WBB44_08515, partial [Candidatus Nanopelagicales bacterium]